MRRGLKQSGTLGEGLSHKPECALFEITQAAMDELGGSGGCGGRIIAFFGEHHPKSASCRVARDGRAMNAAANDEKVEGLSGQLSLPAMGRVGAKRPAKSSVRSAQHEAHPAPARPPASPYQVADDAEQEHAEREPNRKALPSRHGDVARLGLFEIEGVLAGEAGTGFFGLLVQ